MCDVNGSVLNGQRMNGGIPSYVYIFLLISITLLVHYPVLGHQFQMHWDDQWVVMNHYTTGGFHFHNLRSIFIDYYHGQYAPFNELFYLLLYNIGDSYNPFVFHTASLCLHIINACLVYVVISELLLLYTLPYIRLMSFFTALIFSIHPFNVEAVAWMSASKILVYSFFYLLASYTFLCYLKNNKMRYYVYTVIFFIFSFLGKEQAVTFPVWMLLICWFIHKKMSLRQVVWLIVPFFILAFCFGFLTIASQAGYVNTESYPLWQRVVYGCYSLYEYFFKLLLPHNLYYIYPFPSNVGDALPEWLLLYPALLIFSVMFLWKYISRRMVLFCLLIFVVHIAVALHIISLNRYAVVADRYAYLSSVGVALLLVWGTFECYKRFGKCVAFILCFYLLAIGGYANWRGRIWYDSSTLKKEILK